MLFSRVRLFVTPWTPAHQVSPSLTISWSLPNFTSIESVMLSNHLYSLGTVDSLEKAPMLGKIEGKRGRRQQRMRWLKSLCLVTQLCPALCDPTDCSLPGYSVHGISQARILEWVTMPSSRGSSHPRDQTQVSSTAGGFFTI